MTYDLLDPSSDYWKQEAKEHNWKSHEEIELIKDELTKDILRDVGKWLDDSAYAHDSFGISINIYRKDINSFAAGKMPDRRKHISFK